MESKILSYGETAIIKSTFHKETTSININEIKINKIVLFDKTSYGNEGSLKHYIGYRHTDGIILPQNIRLPQLIGYVKHFSDENKFINFLVTDKKMLKKYNKIWCKIKFLFKKELDKNPVYENKYITTKLNRTEFEHRILINNERHDIPIELKNNSRHEYLSVILLESILIYPESYCSNKYYPQILPSKSSVIRSSTFLFESLYLHSCRSI